MSLPEPPPLLGEDAGALELEEAGAEYDEGAGALEAGATVEVGE